MSPWMMILDRNAGLVRALVKGRSMQRKTYVDKMKQTRVLCDPATMLVQMQKQSPVLIAYNYVGNKQQKHWLLSVCRFDDE